MTAELLEELETVIKRFSLTPDQAADLRPALLPATEGEEPAEIKWSDELTITYQRVTDRAPSLLVTTPAGDDCWALPIPHRPDWLTKLIVDKAPEWWLKK